MMEVPVPETKTVTYEDIPKTTYETVDRVVEEQVPRTVLEKHSRPKTVVD